MTDTRKKESGISARALLLLISAPTLALTVLYCIDTAANPPAFRYSLYTGALALLLFILLGMRFIPVWADAWGGRSYVIKVPEGARSGRWDKLHPWIGILLTQLVFRLLIFVLAYALYIREYGYNGGILDLPEIWNPVSFDGRHYLNIAEHWYASSGSDRYLLVFLPFYPILIRWLQPLTGNWLTSGLLVSNSMLLLSGIVLYELVLLDHSRKTARRAVRYLQILPAAILFSAPLSDSTFLFFSLLCVYAARRRLYPLAGIAGGFASFTRIPGITLLAPVCFELISDILSDRRAKAERQTARSIRAGDIFSLLLIPAGLGAYLVINKEVSGDWFRFLTYQSENWQQAPGWFFRTTATQTDSLLIAIREGDTASIWGLWIPNLCSVLASLVIMILAVRRIRPSYTAWFIGCFLVTMGTTWLLSAPRYLAAMFPLPIALSLLSEKKRIALPLTLVCLGGLVLYMLCFIRHWYVY